MHLCCLLRGASPLLENADNLLVASPSKEERHAASVLLAHRGLSGFFDEPAVLQHRGHILYFGLVL